jgi:hypothetical protein
MTPCNCQTTGHDPHCWNSIAGYYVNGVKVATLPPPVVTPTITITFNWPVWRYTV